MAKDGSFNSIRVFRWIMVALSAVLAAVLIARGNVLIGGLIGALAVGRAVVIVQMQRRRAEFRRRMGERRGGFQGRGRF